MRKLLLLTALTVCLVTQAQDNQNSCCKNKTCSENKICCKDSTCNQRPYDQYKKAAENWNFDVALGWNLMTQKPDGVSSRFFGSRELTIGFRYKYTPQKALQSYSVGLWAKWSRYALDDKAFKLDKGVVGLTDFPAGTSSCVSRINIFSLSVPFLFTQRFGQKSKWSVTLGPVLNFNLRGRINNEYDKGDDNIDITTKGLEYRPVTVDLMGMVTYRGVSVFCKYSPMSVLKTDMGPQFHAVTLGVLL